MTLSGHSLTSLLPESRYLVISANCDFRTEPRGGQQVAEDTKTVRPAKAPRSERIARSDWAGA